MRSTRILIVVALITASTAGFISIGERAHAVSACAQSSTWTLCISVANGTLSGEVPVTVTTTGTGAPFEIDVSWGTSATSTTHLYSDFGAPWSFIWPTQRYVDASRYLVARTKSAAGVTGAPVAIAVTIDNNISTAPNTPTDYAAKFMPRPSSGDPIFAATGDGADGTDRGNAVAASILASPASTFLQLGDVYERGTRTEFFNHYGLANFDYPGTTSRWGALASFTLASGGNHELHTNSDDGFFDYWHHRPLYFTEVVGGVRVLSFASECSRVGGCGTTSQMYAWAQSVLQANTLPCVVGIWHRPVISGIEDSAAMAPIWSLLAGNGGDLVAAGHSHTMATYKPMNAALQADQPDSHMVQIVAGAGGHNLSSTTDTDSRVQWQRARVAGSAYITAVNGNTGTATALNWRFADSNGNTVNSSSGVSSNGSVSCGAGPPASNIYTDSFANLDGWPGAVRLTIDPSMGSPAVPSVHAVAVAQTAYGYHDISPAVPTMCASGRVNLASIGTNTIVLRTRSTANVGVSRLALTPTRVIIVRNDTTAVTTTTGVTLPSGWNTVELCTTIGTSGNATALLNGVTIANISANFGTALISRLQLFDNNSSGRTFDARFDDLVVDTHSN